MAEDFLNASKFAYVGLGFLIQAAIGQKPGISIGDFAISAAAPANLTITIGAGSIYAMEAIDANAYSTLGTDANQIMKQGILIAPKTIAITPPTTSGFEQYYLVEIGFNEADADPIVPPYFNTADPEVPLNGANNSGNQQPVIRQNHAVVSLKAGAAAAVGNAIIPTPDIGFSGMWVVRVINGQTQITSASWFPYSGAPLFPSLESLFGLFQQVIPVSTTYFVNNATGSDTTGSGSAQFPWATITHALAVVATYNLGGNTVTIQLGLTGVVYPGPGGFSAPSNGTLIIRGDPAAQASYIISGTPAAGSPVIQPVAGTLNLTGLTVQNLSTAANTIAVGAVNSTLLLQNVTITTNSANASGLVAASGANAGIGAGCIFAGNATAAVSAENGGTVGQTASTSTSGSPAYSVATVLVTRGGVYSVAATGLSWTGTPTGTRFAVSLNGVISTLGGGASYFPGTVAGTPVTGGQYT